MIWIVGLTVAALVAAPILALWPRRRRSSRTLVYSFEEHRWTPAEERRVDWR